MFVSSIQFVRIWHMPIEPDFDLDPGSPGLGRQNLKSGKFVRKKKLFYILRFLLITY